MIDFTIKYIDTTNQKRKVYARGLCYNVFDLIQNDISIIELDSKINTPGGCFLYTHHRDNGYVLWYPSNILSDAYIMNTRGSVLKTFYL